jgi:hypothetical protein
MLTTNQIEVTNKYYNHAIMFLRKEWHDSLNMFPLEIGIVCQFLFEYYTGDNDSQIKYKKKQSVCL